LERRLAAILAADAVGYSRLMAADEEATFATLSAYRENIDGLVADHCGRVFGSAGDSVIAEFASPVEAVRCAADIQRELEKKNAELPEDRRMQFRVGVNLGDVMAEGENLFGDGVNIAARLEGLADAGGICISQTVYDQIKNKLEFGYEYLGEQEVKNIAEPIRTYRVMMEARSFDSPRSTSMDAMLKRPAVAVLPFANMSGDPEQEYFSDGLTEDIITALALWRSFPVIARNSSFVYKGKAVDMKQVGRELAARYVVEGSVRKSGNRVRITAQLIDTATGHHVWVEKFDRNLEDVFALQDEITERIAATLERALGKAELMRSNAKQPGNLDAWDFCLRGRSYLHEWAKDGTAKAREMFERAIELDANYGEAFADLAWTHSRDLLMEDTTDCGGSIAQMYEAARRAVALDDASSRAHFRLSTAYLWRNEHDLAIAEGRRAVELNPMNADARQALGNKLDLAGDPEGISMMEQAQNLNPQDPQRNMQLTFLARAYLNAGQYERSVKCARNAIQRRPDYPNAYYILAIALGHLGNKADARTALDECERLHPGFARGRSQWQPYLNAASNEHLHKGLSKAGLQE
jgi:adenylate cyclase